MSQLFLPPRKVLLSPLPTTCTALVFDSVPVLYILVQMYLSMYLL